VAFQKSCAAHLTPGSIQLFGETANTRDEGPHQHADNRDSDLPAIYLKHSKRSKWRVGADPEYRSDDAVVLTTRQCHSRRNDASSISSEEDTGVDTGWRHDTSATESSYRLDSNLAYGHGSPANTRPQCQTAAVETQSHAQHGVLFGRRGHDDGELSAAP
jgi:hypothetical protein